jgi:hypothetical protein
LIQNLDQQAPKFTEIGISDCGFIHLCFGYSHGRFKTHVQSQGLILLLIAIIPLQWIMRLDAFVT